MIDEGIRTIIDGTCEVAIMSILVGGAGLNCQTMNRIIFMDPPTTDVQKRQAKGSHGMFHQLMILGRIARGGQRDPAPKWTVIHCKTEGFDAVSIARCEKNLSEAQAILLIEEKHEEEGEHDEAENDKNKPSRKNFIEIFD